ncbi:predicted protein [Lichtheimia corymbifera JMRC:FSU:9682]|uniref:Uncharacterized protein n=1 Tax=Lichtheimia corymbifera JMRC:FSU:9682 TaxID=1263082 RepID=A0A068SAK2_9FUNG|nr:predicted protein [Lichtheimia corymbifera JMRC:FSU:9682]
MINRMGMMMIGQLKFRVTQGANFLVALIRGLPLVVRPPTFDMLPPPAASITINNPVQINQLNQLTTTIHDCIEKLVSAFDARACWFLNSKQLDSALIDANAIIGIAPWSPLGYLHAGNIHVIEKRHQSAVGIYDKGLQHVPKSDPNYHQLMEARAIAKDKIDRHRIDYLSMLPLDIVMCNIIPRIVGGKRLVEVGKDEDHVDQHLPVCRIWRRRITMADGLSFHFNRPTASQQLSDMLPVMRSLIVTLGRFDWVTRFVREGFKFQALKYLNIQCKEWEGKVVAFIKLINISSSFHLTNLQGALGSVINIDIRIPPHAR